VKKPGGGGGGGIDENAMMDNIEKLGVTSTLSPAYDSTRADPEWHCVFCKKPSHYKGMGDLFGPYFVPKDIVPAGVSSNKVKSKEELATKFLVDTPSKKKKKKKIREDHPLEEESGDDVAEIWFHEDCICWMPNVTLIGNRLYGLEDAVSAALGAVCYKCKRDGATLACVKGGCRLTVHFPCAVEARWRIREEVMEACCPSHAPRKK